MYTFRPQLETNIFFFLMGEKEGGGLRPQQVSFSQLNNKQMSYYHVTDKVGVSAGPTSSFSKWTYRRKIHGSSRHMPKQCTFFFFFRLSQISLMFQVPNTFVQQLDLTNGRTTHRLQGQTNMLMIFPMTQIALGVPGTYTPL